MSCIALYEPDQLMRALLGEWLRGAGYRVRDSVPRSDETAGVDLVIVSTTMPKRESDALLGLVQSVHPRTPVIALSSRARAGMSSDGAAARALGVERVVAKPLTRNELLAAVRAVLPPAEEATLC
jgi:DNA-binding response OmpR family regulator